MRKTIIINFLMLVTVLFLSSCGKSTHDDSIQALTENNSGSSVTLLEGETFTVSLRGNGTTGYMWDVVPGAESIVEQQGNMQYIVDSNLAGSPGTAIFTFKAIALGNATLQLIYHRPWETGVPPIQTFEVTISVTN